MLEMLAGFAQELFARDVEGPILFWTPKLITASRRHFDCVAAAALLIRPPKCYVNYKG